MQRIMDLSKRLNNRTNVRLAILAVVLGVGGFAVYQGVQRLGSPRQSPVVKKVITGPQTIASAQLATAAVTEQPTTAPASLYETNSTAPPSTMPPTALPPRQPSNASRYSASLNNEADPYAAIDPYAQSAATGQAIQQAAASPAAETSLYGDAQAQVISSAAPATLPENVLPSKSYGTAATEVVYGAGVAESQSQAVNEEGAPAVEPKVAAGDYVQATAAPVEVAPLEVADDRAYAAQPQPLATPLGARQGGSRSIGAGQENGAGVPGERTLEGPQTPSLTLEKFAPAEIQVGKPATFEIRVRNVGQAPAQQVVVTDHVPRGTKLIDAQPQPEQNADGSLAWQLDTMQPGDEVSIQMNLMPQQEGEIGSVAQVGFAAHATARAICTRPLLKIEHTVPQQVMIGETLTMAITVTNPGSGAASGVVIEEDVPEGLSHVAGRELEYEVGTLRPGESKRLELTLKAEKAGVITNTIHAHGEAGLVAEHNAQVEVIAPQLQVDVNGPKKRFLERQATHTLSVANPGTAAARDVELVAYLPKGLKFVDTDSQGQYDPQQHAVYWSLEELPASKAGAVKLTTLPIEPGEQRLRIEGHAERGLSVANEQIVQVEAAAELIYTITDLSDPIEVGAETVYQIRVSNVGTKVATNIRINAILPAEMRALGGEGPTKAVSDAQRVNFEPIARLNPQDEAVFQVQAQALRPGDHLLKVQVSSEEWPTPVTREESTRVYVDQ